MPNPKASPEFIEALNAALMEEMASSIQYLWDHILARGLESPAIAQMFKESSMVEMRHAYSLAERIDLLGGLPTTTIGRIKIGGDLTQMLSDNLQAEYAALEVYKRLIKGAQSEEDVITTRMLEDILKETEEQVDQLEAILEKK